MMTNYIIKIDSVRKVTNNSRQDTGSGIESEILLPSSTCTASSSLGCEQFAGIIFKKKHYFSKDDLTICKNIHRVKGTQGNLKVEEKWFERVVNSVRTSCSFLVISDTICKDSRT